MGNNNLEKTVYEKVKSLTEMKEQETKLQPAIKQAEEEVTKLEYEILKKGY